VPALPLWLPLALCRAWFAWLAWWTLAAWRLSTLGTSPRSRGWASACRIVTRFTWLARFTRRTRLAWRTAVGVAACLLPWLAPASFLHARHGHLCRGCGRVGHGRCGRRAHRHWPGP
jgi:hypothetical protein